MTADTNEALAGELRGYAALLQGHPDIEDQSIRLPGTSEVIDLRETLDALSERAREAADMLTAQAAKLAETEAAAEGALMILMDERAALSRIRADARRQALRELEDMHERGWARESDRGNHDAAQWHREIAEHIRHMQIEAEQ